MKEESFGFYLRVSEEPDLTTVTRLGSGKYNSLRETFTRLSSEDKIIYYMNNNTQFIDAVVDIFVCCADKNSFIREICKGLIPYR